VKRIKFFTADDDLEINRLEHLCEENKIAFVMSEIIQGEGGVNVASRKFIKNLYDTTRKYHVPLIIDEVQTGIGRTGRWRAYEYYDIKPDIKAVAKSIQIGVVLFDQILEPKRKGVLSSTWVGEAE
jgi:4-aminobutyrate aminotransferase